MRAPADTQVWPGDLDEPADLDLVHRVVHGLAAQGAGDQFVLGVSIGATQTFVGTDGGNACITPGCLMKPMLAMLVAETFGHPEDWPSDGLGSLLEAEPAGGAGRWRRIGLRHLLDHTHGLDDSSLPAAPRDADGWLDARTLCARLGAYPLLHRPGEYHSYGNAGAWLWAAILERRTRRRHHELLREHLARLHHADGEVSGLCGNTCPANDREMRLSLRTTLSLLSSQFQATSAARAMQRLLIRLPGWAPAERAVGQGWKYFGAGWFGHNAMLPGRTGVFRFHAVSQVAVAFMGESTSAFTRFSRMFSRVLPEFAHFRPPRVVVGGVAREVAGTYGNSAEAIDLRCDAAGVHCRHRSLSDDAQIGEWTRLQPTQDGVFIPVGAARQVLPFVQCIAPSPEGYRHLWNGRRLLRRSSGTADIAGTAA